MFQGGPARCEKPAHRPGPPERGSSSSHLPRTPLWGLRTSASSRATERVHSRCVPLRHPERTKPTPISGRASYLTGGIHRSDWVQSMAAMLLDHVCLGRAYRYPQLEIRRFGFIRYKSSPLPQVSPGWENGAGSALSALHSANPSPACHPKQRPESSNSGQT